MTRHTAAPTLQRHRQDRTAPAGGSPETDGTVRSASLVAGAGLLLMALLAGAGYMVAIEGLVTPGDAGRTAADIIASRGLFLAGIVSLCIVIALDVVVAWALYRVFAPVSRTISAVAAWARLVYAAVFAVAVAQLVGVLGLLDAPGQLVPSVADQALLGIGRFDGIWDAGLILFGAHLIVVGWLAFRSGYVPRWLGVLLGIAGAGYVVDSIGALLSQGAWTDLSTVAFAGEFLLALWLVVRGRRITLGEAGRGAPSARRR